MKYKQNFKIMQITDKYIHFYNYCRRQKKLKCLSPMSYHQLLENAT
ncbi:MAG: IS3 family transposase [Clostridia bacterium]|jgi:hypothetical protein